MLFIKVIPVSVILLLALSGTAIHPVHDVSPFSSENNLAYNDGSSTFPHPLDSDNGWGGGAYKWHINDGIRLAASHWTYGLAFTGGRDEYIDTCGWRQAAINFGRTVLINRTVIWLERDYFDEYSIEYLNEITGKWDKAVHVTGKLATINTYINFYWDSQEIFHRLSIPCEDTFKVIKTEKIRFKLNNCQGGHGWINEFEVYYDKPGERPQCLVIRR